MSITNRLAVVSALAASSLAPPLAAQEADPALARLNASPRHHEWVDLEHAGGVVRAFVVHPESETPTAAVLLIHENRGLTDWVRALADQVAEAGYLAIAPDLLWGFGPDGEGTAAFADRDAARNALYEIAQEQTTSDLQAAADWALARPSVDGRLYVAGFCWGGKQAFRFAADREDLVAAFVFYGTSPDEDGAFAAITAPVHGFYGGADARVNAGIPDTERRMAAAGKTYDAVTYDGAGHGFMRSGEDPDPDPADAAARAAAWERWMALMAAD